MSKTDISGIQSLTLDAMAILQAWGKMRWMPFHGQWYEYDGFDFFQNADKTWSIGEFCRDDEYNVTDNLSDAACCRILYALSCNADSAIVAESLDLR